MAAMRLDITPDNLLSAADRQLINLLSNAVYPVGGAESWAEMPIQWAPQTIRVLIWEESRLVSHVGALVRAATLDGRNVRVGGIGGVMTDPEDQGRGYAKAGLVAMGHHLIDKLQVSFSLLFCASNLYSFYGKLGWRLLSIVPLVEQQGGAVPFTLNRAMVQDGTGSAPAAGTLDLCGPPW
jgi:aminoglycoside 2'-N-acetyltransferase I